MWKPPVLSSSPARLSDFPPWDLFPINDLAGRGHSRCTTMGQVVDTRVALQWDYDVPVVYEARVASVIEVYRL